MSDQHHYLPISKIEAGMILANELLDKQGQVLLPAGTILSKQMLASLLLHDIHQLSVLTNDVEATPLNEAHIENTKQRLEVIFRHAPFDDARSTLVKLMTKYRLGSAL